jgi:hypothetical protein
MGLQLPDESVADTLPKQINEHGHRYKLLGVASRDFVRNLGPQTTDSFGPKDTQVVIEPNPNAPPLSQEFYAGTTLDHALIKDVPRYPARAAIYVLEV